MGVRWEPGQSIVRREVLGLGPHVHRDRQPWWHGKPWEAIPVYVVEDTDDGLVTYIPEGAQLGFVDGEWPTPDCKHPWYRKARWQGHGCLMVQRPGDPYAVWHFWTGPNRDFACWYINLQADFVRTEIGYDTQDFELDFVVSPDGSYVVKDAEVLGDRVREGRFTPELVDWVRELGAQVAEELDAGHRWWDASWSGWEPPREWRNLGLPEGWAEAACPDLSGQWLMVVSGWTGAGKSTMADHLAGDLGATVASFDWVVSGLRAGPEVWAHVELPVELQRRVGWNLLSRVAEQQLRRGASCVLDLVGREEPIQEWRQLAAEYGASFAVVECICTDLDVHRSRVDGRERRIPGWYELEWDHVEKGRQLYEPLPEPKIAIDAVATVDQNLDRVRQHLTERNRLPPR